MTIERAGTVVVGLPVSMTFDGCGRSGIFTADGCIAVPPVDGSGPFVLGTVDGAQLTVSDAVTWWTAGMDCTSWGGWRTNPTLAPRTLEPAVSSNALLVPTPPSGRWRTSIRVAIHDRSTGITWTGGELFGVTIPPARP